MSVNDLAFMMTFHFPFRKQRGFQPNPSDITMRCFRAVLVARTSSSHVGLRLNTRLTCNGENEINCSPFAPCSHALGFSLLMYLVQRMSPDIRRYCAVGYGETWAPVNEPSSPQTAVRRSSSFPADMIILVSEFASSIC